ncbi:hypothetical protein ABCS02_11745 [Microbacterium sp. X-17]|uniref:hypothetical protein n=1 Tax=Microbacterium sp. X-17 TaxID=3144404 RepID=UPI0031F4B57E
MTNDDVSVWIWSDSDRRSTDRRPIFAGLPDLSGGRPAHGGRPGEPWDARVAQVLAVDPTHELVRESADSSGRGGQQIGDHVGRDLGDDRLERIREFARHGVDSVDHDAAWYAEHVSGADEVSAGELPVVAFPLRGD